MSIEHLLYVFPEPLPLPRARGVQVAHSVAAMARKGIRVTLAYVPGGARHPFTPIGREVPENVTLLPLSRGLLGTRIKSHALFMMRLVRWLHAQRGMNNLPQCVFFRHVKAAAWFARHCHALPYVYEAHEVFSKTAKPSQRERIRAMERSVLEGASLIVTNSEGTACGLASAYDWQREITVLQNGVELPVHLPIKPWKESCCHLIYAGSLFGWKGVDDLVDAMAFLPGSHLQIVGGTSEQIDRLRQRMQPQGGTVEFFGHLEQYEVQELLGKACVAVLPNRPDPDSAFTSPLKLFEYMAAGCAVVATNLPAIRDVVGAEGAAWAMPGSPNSLAEAIRQLCARDDGGAAMGVAGRNFVRSMTWDQRAGKLLSLMNGCS